MYSVIDQICVLNRIHSIQFVLHNILTTVLYVNEDTFFSLAASIVRTLLLLFCDAMLLLASMPFFFLFASSVFFFFLFFFVSVQATSRRTSSFFLSATRFNWITWFVLYQLSVRFIICERHDKQISFMRINRVCRIRLSDRLWCSHAGRPVK